MIDAYIFDYVRTPPGRGKPVGKLHEITPINLASQALMALRERNKPDTKLSVEVVIDTGRG